MQIPAWLFANIFCIGSSFDIRHFSIDTLSYILSAATHQRESAALMHLYSGQSWASRGRRRRLGCDFCRPALSLSGAGGHRPTAQNSQSNLGSIWPASSGPASHRALFSEACRRQWHARQPRIKQDSERIANNRTGFEYR